MIEKSFILGNLSPKINESLNSSGETANIKECPLLLKNYFFYWLFVL